MTRTSRASRQDARTAGYALIEIVVAMAVVALVVALVLPWVSREPGPAALEAKAYELAALFREDRNAAMFGRRDVVSRIDVTNRVAVSGSRGQSIKIPDSVGMDLVQADVEAFPGGGGIRFFPSGRATGGAVTLRRGSIGYRISVNWLTAKVEVEPVQVVAAQ